MEKLTDENLVAFECRPIDLLIVKLDQSPIFGITPGFGRDLDLLRVEHKANGALVESGTTLRDLVVEGAKLLSRIRFTVL